MRSNHRSPHPPTPSRHARLSVLACAFCALWSQTQPAQAQSGASNASSGNLPALSALVLLVVVLVWWFRKHLQSRHRHGNNAAEEAHTTPGPEADAAASNTRQPRVKASPTTSGIMQAATAAQASAVDDVLQTLLDLPPTVTLEDIRQLDAACARGLQQAHQQMERKLFNPVDNLRLREEIQSLQLQGAWYLIKRARHAAIAERKDAASQGPARAVAGLQRGALEIAAQQLAQDARHPAQQNATAPQSRIWRLVAAMWDDTDNQQAQAAWQTLLKLGVVDLDACWQLAKTALWCKQPALALHACQQAQTAPDFDPNTPSSDRAHMQSALLETMAECHFYLADWEQSLACRRQACQGYQRLLAVRPDSQVLQRDLALCRIQLGRLLCSHGELAEAAQLMQQAVTQARQSLRQDATTWQGILATSLLVWANAEQDLGALQDAGQHYQEALDITQTSLQQTPDDPDLRYDQINILCRQGDLFSQTGPLTAAHDAYQQALTLAQALSTRDPARLEWQQLLLSCLQRYGQLLGTWPDRHGQALDYLLQAQALVQKLLQQHDNDLELQGNQYTILQQIGDIQHAQGQLAAARSSLEQAQSIIRALQQRDAVSMTLHFNLCATLQRLGDVCVDGGDAAAAGQYFQQAITLCLQQLQRLPEHAAWQRNLLILHERIGMLHQTQGELEIALRHFQQQLAISQTLAQSGGQDAQRDLAVAWFKVAELQQQSGELLAALQHFRQAAALQLARCENDVPEAAYELAICNNRIASVLRTQGESAAALAHLQQSLQQERALCQRMPTETGLQRHLTIKLDTMADILQEQGDLAMAQRCVQQGLALRQKLAQREPQNVERQSDVVVSHYKLLCLYKAAQQSAEASTHARQGLAILQQLQQEQRLPEDIQGWIALLEQELADLLA